MCKCADKKNSAGSNVSVQLCRFGNEGGKMRLAIGSMLSITLIAMFGCALNPFDVSGKERALEDAQRKYTELVRWGEIDHASAYVDPKIADDFMSTAELLKDVRFTDFESGELKFGEGSETAIVNVVYHAYSKKTLIEETFRERQEWYREANADNQWRVRPNLAAIARKLSGAQ
jgi:hypothetical protein